LGCTPLAIDQQLTRLGNKGVDIALRVTGCSHSHECLLQTVAAEGDLINSVSVISTGGKNLQLLDISSVPTLSETGRLSC
jgi:hypothetical protein